MYGIEVKLAEKRIEVTISGFWDHDETVRYEAEIVAAMEKARQRIPYFDFLVHADSLNPVAKENINAVERIVAAQMRLGLRKSALVCPSAITRMQLRRMSGNSDQHRLFDNDADALAWLAE